MPEAGTGAGGFPVFPPDNPKWSWPATEPIVGPHAKEDLEEIREHDRRLGRKLARDVIDLRDRRLRIVAERVPDRPGIGPRYMVDLRDGYLAVCWVLQPPPERSGIGPALWVERVVLRSAVKAAFDAIAPRD